MKIATSELEHLREEVKSCHRIIKNLQKKREFVGLTDEDMTECIVVTCNTDDGTADTRDLIRAVEAKLKEKNT